MTAKAHIKKRNKTPKKQKSRGQQLLISRFFSPAVPKASKPQRAPEQAESTRPNQRASSTGEKASSEHESEHLRSPLKEAPSGQLASIPIPIPSQEKNSKRLDAAPEGKKVACEEKNSEKTKVCEETHAESARKDDTSKPQEPDTPTTAVLLSPSQNAGSASQCSSPLNRTPRKRTRRRVIVMDDDEDDEESEEEPVQKRSRSDDPDFQVEGDDEQSGNEEEDLDVVISQDLLQDDSGQFESGVEQETTRRAKKASQPLSSFGLDRGTEPNEIARDPKRRRQFTQKIGRLEKNSFFLRRTGGGGDPVKETQKANKAAKYTPLESQVIKLRKQYPDMVLVVECGYKYRLFDKDASIASKVLRVASFFDHNFLTAGFPTHRLAFHVRRLVEAGYKVGVVSQSETAALKRANSKSGLFQRSLSAVYTKGTIVADGKLGGPAMGVNTGAKSACFIMTILEVESKQAGSKKKKIALAAVDSASGEVFYDCFEDDDLRSDLESRLVAIEPVEVLMTKRQNSRPTELVVKAFCESMSSRLERMNDNVFEPNVVSETLKSRIQGDRDSPSDPEVLACLGALIEYLKQFKLELSVTTALQYKEFQTTRQMSIGGDVLKNFEVFGNSNNGSVHGSLMGLVNQTRTAFGSRQMRQWISHPLVNGRDIVSRLDAVEYISGLINGNVDVESESDTFGSVLSSVIRNLHKLPDLDQGLTRIACHKSTPSELVSILSTIRETGETFAQLRLACDTPSTPHLLQKLSKTAPDIGGIMDNPIVRILDYEAATKNQYDNLFHMDEPLNEILGDSEGKDEFVSNAEQLKSVSDELKAAEKDMIKILRKLRSQHSNPKWEWKKVANEEYLLEVPVTRASKLPRSWTIVSQTKAVKRYRPPEATNGFERVLCSRERTEVVSSQCWQSYLKMFADIALPLRAIVRILADLDCLSSLARVAIMPGYAKPEIEVDTRKPSGLVAECVRHPLTELLSTCPTYVPNDIRLGSGEHEIALVISGPNYGGKSSYARMTALVVILAQIGSFVPAAKAKLCPYDSMFARMGSSDSISKGMSSLMVELAETSRILSNASSRSLVVLDELGRGTSTHDGTAVAYATLSHLLTKISCTTIFVTHYPVLASLRSEHPLLVRAAYMNYVETQAKGTDAANGRQGLRSCRDSVIAHKQSSRIVFLYKLTDGVAPSSYGLNVARLAGIPEEVVDEAQCKAVELESTQQLQKRDGEMAHLFGTALWSQPDVVQKVHRLLNNGIGTT
ncbi:DNA mismatch repair protein MutS [Gracilaria domingensis]|nr:DNA mismatch repair protein MutS [Gracilaria domingensis]